MVLITSLCAVELYFFFFFFFFFFLFFLILFREQLTLFLGDLEFQKCAHAHSRSVTICIVEDDTNFSFNLIEMKISFLHDIPLYPMNGNH